MGGIEQKATDQRPERASGAGSSRPPTKRSRPGATIPPPVHDLRRDANATGGALAHHFPTKKELGLAVIRDQVARAVEETWIRPILSAPTAAQGIQTVLEAIISELERNGSVSGCPLNNLVIELARQDDDLRLPLSDIFARWTQAIADKLRADIASGALARLDPESAATLVVAAYSGAMAMAKASQSPAPLRSCATQLAELLRTHSKRRIMSARPDPMRFDGLDRTLPLGMRREQPFHVAFCIANMRL